ncbi:MAG: DNA repair protein RadC [Chloroflexi bacterium]|nr:DNA repair protein RadC [Chloroflexota bacterium]
MPSIREWPETTRPRERLIAHGALSTGDDELLAVLIGSGTPGRSALALARDLLIRVGGMRGLAQADHTRLRGEGIGPAAAARILAARELGQRAMAAGVQGEVIDSPEAAARALGAHFAALDREEVKVALLSRKHRLLGVVPVYSGNVAGTSVRIGELFTEALRRHAPAIVIGHNHPSGDPAPSPEDLRTTRDAVAAGRLLGVDVLDHVVFGAGRWISLGEQAGNR